MAAALSIAYAARLGLGPIGRAARRIAGLGYAVPGAVVAVGVLLPLAWLDHRIDAIARAVFGVSTGLLVTGGVAALVFAYLVRFLAVSMNAVDAAFVRVTGHMDGAARTLGAGPARVLRRIHLPMLRGGLLTAALLVFVDTMKELPATLILRPFDVNTLAVRAYELASDERLADAAAPALAIVVVGLLPVILLSRAVARGARMTGPRPPADGLAIAGVSHHFGAARAVDDVSSLRSARRDRGVARPVRMRQVPPCCASPRGSKPCKGGRWRSAARPSPSRGGRCRPRRVRSG